jgi:DNA-binding HxlR family transcriptional regulator
MGKGHYQKNIERDARIKILTVLNDGEWHRNKELLTIGISSATLHKHLNELTKTLLEKKIDKQSSEYPFPVYYRLKCKVFQSLFTTFKTSARNLDNTLLEKEDFKRFMFANNYMIGHSILAWLRIYAYEGNVKELNDLIESYLFPLILEDVQLLRTKLDNMKKQGRDTENFIVKVQRDYQQEMFKLGKP